MDTKHWTQIIVAIATLITLILGGFFYVTGLDKRLAIVERIQGEVLGVLRDNNYTIKRIEIMLYQHLGGRPPDAEGHSDWGAGRPN